MQLLYLDRCWMPSNLTSQPGKRRHLCRITSTQMGLFTKGHLVLEVVEPFSSSIQNVANYVVEYSLAPADPRQRLTQLNLLPCYGHQSLLYRSAHFISSISLTFHFLWSLVSMRKSLDITALDFGLLFNNHPSSGFAETCFMLSSIDMALIPYNGHIFEHIKDILGTRLLTCSPTTLRNTKTWYRTLTCCMLWWTQMITWKVLIGFGLWSRCRSKIPDYLTCLTVIYTTLGKRPRCQQSLQNILARQQMRRSLMWLGPILWLWKLPPSMSWHLTPKRKGTLVLVPLDDIFPFYNNVMSMTFTSWEYRRPELLRPWIVPIPSTTSLRHLVAVMAIMVFNSGSTGAVLFVKEDGLSKKMIFASFGPHPMS